MPPQPGTASGKYLQEDLFRPTILDIDGPRKSSFKPPKRAIIQPRRHDRHP